MLIMWFGSISRLIVIWKTQDKKKYVDWFSRLSK